MDNECNWKHCHKVCHLHQTSSLHFGHNGVHTTIYRLDPTLSGNGKREKKRVTNRGKKCEKGHENRTTQKTSGKYTKRRSGCCARETNGRESKAQSKKGKIKPPLLYFVESGGGIAGVLPWRRYRQSVQNKQTNTKHKNQKTRTRTGSLPTKTSKIYLKIKKKQEK